MKYIKQLDSIRAIAVILVIISHWIPKTAFINRIPNGEIGVDMFFVLSGFLITQILFNSNNQTVQFPISKSSLLKNFYARITLRIFPIYYLTIFCLLTFSEATGTHIQDAFPYFLTYTSNFYFYILQNWDGMVSHLWSLAVEEQFYLIWPWIILLSDKKYHLGIISFFIFLGIFSHYFLLHETMSSVLTFTCFDAFGLGALLAWVTTYAKEKLKRFFRSVLVVAAAALLVYLIGAMQFNSILIPLRTVVSLGTIVLISYIVIYQENNALQFKIILNNRILIFLGKISYGLYLYHTLVPGLLNSKIINVYFNPLLPDILYKKYWSILYLFENALLLIALAWLSFIFIEKPFLYLKKYFEYQIEGKLQRT